MPRLARLPAAPLLLVLAVALAQVDCATLGGGVSAKSAREIAEEAYVYGYPLVLMDVTRRVMTAAPKASAKKAPMGQFLNIPVFPDPSFKEVVSPNADTLYSSAWLDLSKEPYVLSVPDTHGRYYVMQLLDGWTNVFASPGKRTTGTKKGNFAIVGPGWSETLPEGVQELRSPTDLVWIIGRTQTNGRADYGAVHAIQAGYRLTPLSAWGKPYRPPAKVPVDATVDTRTPPVDQVAQMDAATFFGRLAELLEGNPPAALDAPLVERIAKIGLAPGKPFPPADQKPAIAAAVDQGAKDGLAKIIAAAHAQAGGDAPGWRTSLGLGAYGTDYLKRAATAFVGLGANLSEDAVYSFSRDDADGEPLSGAHRYSLHFDKGATPPVNAFWSITLYNEKQLFVANPIGRYAIGDRDKLKKNPDGSLDIWIQHAAPAAAKESNWLPAPAGSFNLVMRMYWPKEAVLDGTWTPPQVRRAD